MNVMMETIKMEMDAQKIVRYKLDIYVEGDLQILRTTVLFIFLKKSILFKPGKFVMRQKLF